jgi:hypothetical protein
MTTELKIAPIVQVESTQLQTPPDPFAPENLRLSQQFSETAGVKKLLTTVPVRKPNPQHFVRVRPGPEWRSDFSILDLRDDREQFIVVAGLAGQLAGELVHKTLHLAVTRQGVPFFWPIRMPMPDGKDMEWWRSEREAAERATSNWIRIRANMELGANEIFEAADRLSEPEWPEHDYWSLIKIAFRDHLIDNLNHPAIKRLRGMA